MTSVTQYVFDGTAWRNEAAAAAAPTTVLGRTDKGTTPEILWTGNKNGQRLLATEAGFLTGGSAWVDGLGNTSGSAKLKMSVYGGGAAAPTKLLGASTNTVTVVAGAAARVVSWTLPNISVAAGTYVWVMVQGNEASVGRLFRGGTGGTSAWGSNLSVMSTDPYGTPHLTSNLYSISATHAGVPIVIPVPSPLMPTGDLPGWRQVYAEDFTRTAALGQVGSVYGSSMRGYSGHGDTSGRGQYSPDAVLSASNSILDFYLHTKTIAGLTAPRVAAPTLNNYMGQTYGRYSLRFRSDVLPGYKIAFMLWPKSEVWNDGEIDWPEGSCGKLMSPASAVKGSLSGNSMTFDPSIRSWSSTDSSGWHVVTTEWTPGLIKWWWDFDLIAQTSIPSGVPTTPMRWTLQAETEIVGSPPAASVAGHLQVDWAVIYAYVP